MPAGAGSHFQPFQFSEEQVVALRSVSLLSVPVAVRLALPGALRAHSG